MADNPTISQMREFEDVARLDENDMQMRILEDVAELQDALENPTDDFNIGDILKTNTLDYMYDPVNSVYKGSVERDLRYDKSGTYYEIAPHSFIYVVPPDLTGIDYDAFGTDGIVKHTKDDNPYFGKPEYENQYYASLATLPPDLSGINVNIRKMLLQETQYINMPGHDKTAIINKDDAYQITIPLLNNMFIPDSYNITDPTMDSIEAGENMDGFRQVTPGSMYKSMVSNQMTIEYQEVASPKYGNAMITKLHRAWVLYMQYVRKGIISPSAKYTMGRKFKFDPELGIVNAGGMAVDSTSYRRALNMMGSIYYFKLGPNGKDIVYWEKGTGIWPSNISLGSYGGGQKGPVKINVTYQVQYMEQMNIETIIEFNELNLRHNSKFSGDITDNLVLPDLLVNEKAAFVTNSLFENGDINSNILELHVGIKELSKIENTNRIVLPNILGYNLSTEGAYDSSKTTNASKANNSTGSLRTPDIRVDESF